MTRVVAVIRGTDARILLSTSLRTREDVDDAIADQVADSLTGSGAPTDATILAADGRRIPYADVDHLEVVDG